MGVPEKLHVEHVILDYFNEHSDKKSITYDTISKITEEIINALQQRDISVYPDFNKDTEVEMAIIDHEIFEHDSVNRIVSIKKSIFRRGITKNAIKKAIKKAVSDHYNDADHEQIRTIYLEIIRKYTE